MNYLLKNFNIKCDCKIDNKLLFFLFLSFSLFFTLFVFIFNIKLFELSEKSLIITDTLYFFLFLEFIFILIQIFINKKYKLLNCEDNQKKNRIN